MESELQGNVLVAQSGGPTAVINSTLAGVILEALNHDCIEEVYGGLNGIQGILDEALVNLAEESQQVIRGLRYTPGSALGSCRYKLKKQKDFERILEVFKAHNIRYFFYIGGNDSQDTAAKIGKYCEEHGYEVRVVGIPKTIDNDLSITDHCPGYGSVAKYVATTVRELACDHQAMGQHDLVSIVEVMGRNAGWIAASAALAKGRGSHPDDAPHLIYFPEVPFSKEQFIDDVQNVLRKNRYCVVVASEGLVDLEGNYLATDSQSKDAFGHANLGGVAESLKGVLEENLEGVSVKTCKLGTTHRTAAHCASLVDNEEAFECGQAAVRAAVDGVSGKMVTLVRKETEAYGCEIGFVELESIANGVKTLPAGWINETKNGVTFAFTKYAMPLIQGEVVIPREQGLPKFVTLAKCYVPRKLGVYELASA